MRKLEFRSSYTYPKSCSESAMELGRIQGWFGADTIGHSVVLLIILLN